jgi:hypothetical protein
MPYAVLLTVLLAGCPSPDDGNPSVLYLGNNGDELHLLLLDHEPDPF